MKVWGIEPFPRPLRHFLRAMVLGGALILGIPGPLAAACEIDNVASLFANGVPAMVTTAMPRSVALWAPFTLAQAMATGAPVQFTEAQADLARTLTPAVRTAPYRWTFGDGGVALGHSVIHRYAHAGTYRLTVSGYDHSVRRWFTFDAATLRVVPADQELGANLGYNVLRGVIALSGITWPLNGAIIVAVVVLLVRRGSGRRIGG